MRRSKTRPSVKNAGYVNQRLSTFELTNVLDTMDTRTPEQRRRIMQAVKTRDTGPEMVVRRLLHRHGYRYRVHRKNLPGCPDIVFSKKRKAIFVHGCYWHGHGCTKGKLPNSKLNYWQPKIEQTKARDARNVVKLTAAGWHVFVIWQCEMADQQAFWQRLREFVEK